MKKNEIQVHIRIEKELHKKIKLLCVELETTMQEYVEKLIKEKFA